MTLERFCQPKIVHNSKSALEAFFAIALNKLGHKKRVEAYLAEADRVVQLGNESEVLTDDALRQKLVTFYQAARVGRLLSEREHLLRALADLCEVSARKLGMKPYPVQVCCALAMIDGYLVQLAPGEGKTLTIGLAATIMGWSKKPCFVITTNDYLAQRDLSLLETLYQEAGVSASVVIQEQSPADKKTAYQADVVYGTAK